MSDGSHAKLDFTRIYQRLQALGTLEENWEPTFSMSLFKAVFSLGETELICLQNSSFEVLYQSLFPLQLLGDSGGVVNSPDFCPA